ncbi:hypothetical protein YC2023_068050 [Brassica napus]
MLLFCLIKFFLVSREWRLGQEQERVERQTRPHEYCITGLNCKTFDNGAQPTTSYLIQATPFVVSCQCSCLVIFHKTEKELKTENIFFRVIANGRTKLKLTRYENYAKGNPTRSPRILAHSQNPKWLPYYDPSKPRDAYETISIVIKYGGPPPNMFSEIGDSKKDDGWICPDFILHLTGFELPLKHYLSLFIENRLPSFCSFLIASKRSLATNREINEEEGICLLFGSWN